MILVDSSVWIDFLESPRSLHQEYLAYLIRLPHAIGVPGPVLQEVLQGIRDEAASHRVRTQLCLFPILLPDTETYVLSATMYQALRLKGFAVPPGDVLVAALAIQHHAELYTLDRKHFDRISAYSALRLHQVPGRHR